MIKHQYRMSDLHTIKDLTRWRAASSEYYRARGPAVVAEVFPNLLSQPYGSEYLYGNTVNAVAPLLHETAPQPAEFVEFANFRR